MARWRIQAAGTAHTVRGGYRRRTETYDVTADGLGNAGLEGLRKARTLFTEVDAVRVLPPAKERNMTNSYEGLPYIDPQYGPCALCGEPVKAGTYGGGPAEMHDPDNPVERGGIVHADCGLNAGWAIS